MNNQGLVMTGRYHALREYENLLTSRRYTLVWEYIHMNNGEPGQALFLSIVDKAKALNTLASDATVTARNYDRLTTPSKSGCPYWVVSTVVTALLEQGWQPWLDAHWANLTKTLCLTFGGRVNDVSWENYKELLPAHINVRVAKYWFDTHQTYSSGKKS